MKYVPEELYLTWKHRAEVSRKYALELLKSHEEISKSHSNLSFRNWLLRNEIDQLKRTPDNKLKKRLFKTQQRLFWAKQNNQELKEVSKFSGLTDKFLTASEKKRFGPLVEKYREKAFRPIYFLCLKRLNRIANKQRHATTI